MAVLWALGPVKKHMAPSDLRQTCRKLEVKVDKRGSGTPAQPTRIAAIGAYAPHGPDGGRTASGRTENHFDIQRKGCNKLTNNDKIDKQ